MVRPGHALEAMLAEPTTRTAISGLITDVVKGLTGVPQGTTFHSVDVTADKLIITYYEE